MGAIGQYINVRTIATGEVRQVNLYSSLDDVGGQGKEFAYGGTACWAAISEDENHENRSGWAYRAANGAVMQVLTHWEEAVSEFNMYNWAWANYQAATGQNHVTLTAFDNASALPNSAQLRGVTNAANAFINCWNLTDVSPFAGLCAYGSAVDFSRMFLNCVNLADISPLANWNTANVTSMADTFYNCRNLTSIDALANWNTANVTNMYGTFYNCRNLTSIDALANWNTANVTSMADTFYQCYNLTDIAALANWNTANVTSMYGTFYYCNRLTSIDALANWNTANVTNMANTFYYCNRLTSIDALANWNTAKVTNMADTFHHCSNLTDIDALANWNTAKVTNMADTFYYCYNLTDIDALANWNTANVTSMYMMFHSCRNLTCAVIPETLASSVNCTLAYAFCNCTNLQGDIYFYGNRVNNATQCFDGCNAYAKNIRAHAGSRTWNSFYSAMGNSTHNDLWNADLVEI